MMFSSIAQMARLDAMPIAVFAKNEAIKKRNQKQLEAENKRLKQQLFLQEERHRTERIKSANDAVKATYAKTNKVKFDRWTIRTTKADEAFSLAIRLRANFTCEHCGHRFSMQNRKDLHCAHFYGRENLNVRYHPLNAVALCKGCHINFDRNNKAAFTAFIKQKLGEWQYAALQAAANAPKAELNSGQEAKISAWYSLTARQLFILRQQGEEGFLDFEPYSEHHLTDTDTYARF